MPRTSDVQLAPFEPASHLPLLERWLREPHVRKWWGDPDRNLAEVSQRGPGGGHVLITSDGAPVGYVCWQRYRDEDVRTIGLGEIPHGAVDLDIMIGEASCLGAGIGPRALRLLLERLGADPAIPMVGLATSVDNSRAIRAYEKAGFSRVGQFDDPEFGPCWFMVAQVPNVGRLTTR